MQNALFSSAILFHYFDSIFWFVTGIEPVEAQFKSALEALDFIMFGQISFFV